MSKFAAGKYAYGTSDRSGFRYRLSDMRMEWNGFFVGKDEWEPKHPQLEPKRRGTDAEAVPRSAAGAVLSENRQGVGHERGSCVGGRCDERLRIRICAGGRSVAWTAGHGVSEGRVQP